MSQSAERPPFTPGPWHSFYSTGDHGGWHIAPSGYAVAPIAHVGLPNAIPERFEEANARLIAAAPELYEALMAVRVIASQYHLKSTPRNVALALVDRLDNIARLASEALAKTDGR